jgi:hypothetical protein
VFRKSFITAPEFEHSINQSRIRCDTNPHRSLISLVCLSEIAPDYTFSPKKCIPPGPVLTVCLVRPSPLVCTHPPILRGCDPERSLCRTIESISHGRSSSRWIASLLSFGAREDSRKRNSRRVLRCCRLGFGGYNTTADILSISSIRPKKSLSVPPQDNVII